MRGRSRGAILASDQRYHPASRTENRDPPSLCFYLSEEKNGTHTIATLPSVGERVLAEVEKRLPSTAVHLFVRRRRRRRRMGFRCAFSLLSRSSHPNAW